MIKVSLLEIVDLQFEKKHKNIGIYGQNLTTRALEIYNEYKKSDKTVVVLSQSKAEAEELFSILSDFEGETYIYPEIDILKRHTSKSNDLVQNSIKVLENLVHNLQSIIIIPIEAIYRTVKNPSDFKNNSFEINEDTVISFDELQRKLVNMGYRRVDSVDVVGEFSKRGSIVDIFSPLSEKPIRLDFFDDELDSMRIFDEITQRSLDRIDSAVIYPTSDFFLTSEEKDIVVEKILAKLDDKKIQEDENYQEKDAVIIAQALSKGIKKMEEQRGKKFDIIFCGKETTDFATGQVGIMLADELNYGVVTNLVDIDAEGGKVTAKKETETGYEKVEITSPCIVTVNKPNYEPRYPTIKSKMAARKKEIAEVSIEVANESAVKEVKLFSPPKRQAGVKIKTGTAEELVAQAIQKMLEAKVF